MRSIMPLSEMQRLRAKRNRIARRIPKNQYGLQYNHGLQLVNNIFSALGTLASALPDIFSNLKKAVEHFSKPKWPHPNFAAFILARQ